MPRQRFDNMALGLNLDAPPWELPPNVWTEAQNVRFRDGATEKFAGQEQVFGTTLGSPLRLIPVSTGQNYYWVYCSTNKVYVTDASTHADITPSGGITAITTNVPGWTGEAFQGYAVLHNGTVDAPIAWNARSGTGVRAEALSFWPADLRCDVIRGFRNYLFALRCTESGTYSPRLVRWTNRANPNSLPTSIDYTDPTNDSGRIELGASEDQVIDLIPLRDRGVLYKENNTWSMQYVGGIDNPFVFRQAFAEIGMLSEWCAAPVRGNHVVLSTNDLVLHDLNQAQSLINGRFRRWLFNQIDPDNYRQCFVVPNYKEREVWICFPEVGHTYANLAFVINYHDNTQSIRQLQADVPHINWGVVNAGAEDLSFDAISGTFDEQTEPFDQQAFNPSTTSLLLSDSSQLYQVDASTSINGNAFTAYWIRHALPLDKDVQKFAYVKRVYPKVIGAAGDTISVAVGVRNTFEDTTAWEPAQTFTIGTDTFINTRAMGRIIDLSFTHTTAEPLRMFGFDIEWDQAGMH